jgi:glycosyltransferase involved in cell wall biosynthesis
MNRPGPEKISPAPLRVLQVNSIFNGGGTDNQTLELAAGLRGCGDRVILSVPAGSRWEPLARKLEIPVETFPDKSWLKHAAIRRWIKIIRAHDIQIIHAHHGRDYWPAVAAARLAGNGCRVVITRHMMTRPRALTRALVLRMSDVVAVSRGVNEVLQNELRGPRARLHQIYGGIDVDAFQSERMDAARAFRQKFGWPDDAVIFGVVGAFHFPRGKGQLEFLEAAAQLSARHPAVRFLIVGKGEMEIVLREKIAALRLEKIAAIAPFTDDIATVMNALDVLVHPAVGTEALGLVLWEAMACARPVIASRLGGIPEAFIENEHGLLVPPCDVPALAEAMRALLENSGQRARFGRAGREHVRRNFNRAAHANRMRELYSKLCAL